MPIYQFDTPSSRLSGTLAQIIAQSGDAQARAAQQTGEARARAAEIGGQAWGGAIRDAGATLGAIPSQLAQQKSDALRQQVLRGEVEDRAAVTAQRQRAQQGQQVLATLTKQYGDDTDAIAKGLTKAGFGDAAEKFLHSASQTAEDRAKLKGIKAQQDAVLAGAIGRAASQSTDPDDFMGRLDHFVLGGQIDAPTRQKFVESLQQAGPDGFDAWKQRTVQWADTVVPKITHKEGDVTTSGVTGAVETTIPRVPKTKAELAADAANPNSPTAARSAEALKKLETPKAPPSLEEQYLLALAKGDKSTADNIAKTWTDKANASRDPAAAAQLAAIRSLSQQEAQARLDDRDVASEKNQQKFEKDYRGELMRALSNRSGTLGSEDAKVQQANHLIGLLDQSYDAKTDTYNIPRVQQTELAMGLAKLVSPGGVVAQKTVEDINQATALGDLGKALTYVTGKPFNGTTQDLVKMYRDSILRQGQIAQDNREGAMAYLRNLAPTDLAEERRTKLESGNLNPLRQSRVAVDAQGNRKLFVSIDGGKTWK